MDEFVDKIPNWLRYILAIPVGLISIFLFYYIGYFSTRFVASEDSIAMWLFYFLYQNGINVIVMVTAMNYVLPKYQFRFTIAVAIIFCSLGMIGLGISIMTNSITVKYIIGLILTFCSFIYACYHTYKVYNQPEEL